MANLDEKDAATGSPGQHTRQPPHEEEQQQHQHEDLHEELRDAGALDDEDSHSLSRQSSDLSSAEMGSVGDVLSREKSDDLDGHRPALYEIRSSSRSRSRRRRPSAATTGAATATAPTALSSTSTGTSLGRRPTAQRRDTVLSRIRSRAAGAPSFSHPLAHVQTTADQLVDFEGADDPYHPLNWPTRKKVVTTLLYGLVTMTATWASSAYSAGTLAVAREYGVGTQTATLGTTLFLFGFGIGPLLWAPLSEVFGRRVAVLAPMFVAACFSFATATAKDLQTIMITRFFGAFFASAPVTNTGGVLGDLYSPAYRGIAMAGYAMAVVGGPVVGMSPCAPIYIPKPLSPLCPSISLMAYPYPVLPIPHNNSNNANTSS